MRKITLQSSSALAASLLIVTALVGAASAAERVRLSSPHLDLTYDADSGRVDLRASDGQLLLRNATAAVVLPAGEMSISDARYRRRHKQAASTEPHLPGEQLIVSCTDAHQQLDLEYRVTLLKDRAAAVFELELTNVSASDLLVHHAEPLRAMLPEDGGCFFGAKGGESAAMKALTNGYIYYDPGRLYDFGPQATQELHSFWNAAFHLSETGQTLVAGYLENCDAEGRILADRKRSGEAKAGGGFSLTARSLYAQHFILMPKATISSGRLLLSLSPDPFSGLEHFADTSGRLHNVKLNPIINGWSTWSGYYSNVTEQDVLKQAKFIARELKPYGMEWVQIDDGFQCAFGDWEGRSDRFPHGMKWLANEIRALGLKPGLWIAPYAISASTDVAKNHPDWLLHDVDGKTAGRCCRPAVFSSYVW